MDITLLENQAIQAALSETWEKAVEVNKRILEIQPQDVTALNRLGRAYFELGKLNEARKTYKKVLVIDRFNQIANKGFKRLIGLRSIKKRGVPKSSRLPLKEIFLEEAGKNKVVKLVHLAPPSVLSQLDNAEEVLLVPKKRTIGVFSPAKIYLGVLPDDLGQRLVRFIKGGNRYQAFVKGVDRQNLQIFIRETFRSPKFRNLPSFAPSGTDYIPYLPPEVIHEEKPEVEPTGEGETPQDSF